MSDVKVMYTQEIPDNKKAIPLEACEENELISIQMKLDKDVRELQANLVILRSVLSAYERCIGCVKSLNRDRFDVTRDDLFSDELNILQVNNILSKKEADTIKQHVREKTETIEKIKEENKKGKEVTRKEKREVTEEEKREVTEEEKKEVTREEKEGKNEAVESIQQEDTEEKKQEKEKTEVGESKKATKKRSLNNAEILIPLTPLIYTPGRVTDTNSFLVRLGTNYHLERNAEQTIQYFEKKRKKVIGEIEKVKVALEEIQKNMTLVDYFIKAKRGGNNKDKEKNEENEEAPIKT